MNALGSKWPSYDSLPSTSSFLLSESEQTEDEADVFSEGEGEGGITKPLSVGRGIALARRYLEFPTHSDEPQLRSKRDQPDHGPKETKHLGLASSPGAAAFSSTSVTPGDLVFAQKCAELNRFIHPLLELLRGLKAGRFNKGLSSFQQSVAMDRLHRILGVLQRPEMGEKYLQNLLQIEMMLKIWFPRTAFQSTSTPSQTTTPRLPARWRQNQLHIPVKKRKLSWPDPEHADEVPTKHNQWQYGKHGSCQAATCLPGSPKRLKTEEEIEPARRSCAVGHQFTDGADTLSRPLYLSGKREGENRKLFPCGSPAAQDSSVSSSDTVTTTDSP